MYIQFTKCFAYFRVFYVLDKIHHKSINYEYDQDALEVAKKYYNDSQTYLQNNHQNDTFLCGMFFSISISFNIQYNEIKANYNHL